MRSGQKRLPGPWSWTRIGLSGGGVKVEADHQGVHDAGGPAVVIGLAQAGLAKSQAAVEGDGRLVVDGDLQEGFSRAELARGGNGGGHQGAGDAAAPRVGRGAERQDLHLAGPQPAEEYAGARGL